MNRVHFGSGYRWFVLAMIVLLASSGTWSACAAELRAGAAKVDISDRGVPMNDPLYAKALVFKTDSTAVVVITIDAVAIGQLGRIKNDFLPHVRARLQSELGIPPASVLINASHCHGVVCADVEPRTVEAVREAWQRLVPVRVGAGEGRELRISENRRLKLKDGRETDVRRAYAMPADEDVVGLGPIDPQIGLLRIDRLDGRPLAAVYNFACHPIEGVPGGGSSGDITGFASRVIEDGLGHDATAIFLQGAAGDINPVAYKNVHQPHDAERLGNLLGLSSLRALKQIQTKDQASLQIVNHTLALPRGTDLLRRMTAIQAEQARLLGALRGTTLDLSTFIPLYVQYKLAPDFPADRAPRYLAERAVGRQDLAKLDAQNRADLEAYQRNVRVMEQLTRLQANLALLKMHQAQNEAAGKSTLDVEVAGLRVGDFRLVTFPGELTVEVGLGIKKMAPRPLTFVAGYTNGYIYYAPTARGRKNPGYAQEDCDCLLAPEWEKLFEEQVRAMLKDL
jgi:hypothetical protein